MIVLRTPKGWTCPKEIDGKRTEDYWRSHQVPMGEMHENPAHVRILEEWMKSYRPEELFDDERPPPARAGRARPAGHAPHERQPARQRRRCCSAICGCPDFRDYAVDGARTRRRHGRSRPGSWAGSCAT